MALRFRRTMKIAPGVRLNLSKSGVSARIGLSGAGVTVGRSGTTVSGGIPGTGLSVSEKIKPRTRQQTSKVIEQETPQKLGFVGWLGLIMLAIGFIWCLNALLN